MKTIAFIPVRGGSKSIPGKNIKLLGGRPLLHWTLEAAVGSTAIDEVTVSSDSPEILACAADFGHPKVRLVRRPDALATDTASTESALLHFAESAEFDRIVLIQATSPLTTRTDLDEALTHMETTGATSLLSVTHEHRFRWKPVGGGFVQPENYEPIDRPRRQDWDGEFVENGAFYITRRDALLSSRCRISGQVAYYVMSPHTSFEIDHPADWEILASLVLSRVKSVQVDRSDIRLLVTDVDGVWTDGGMYFGAEGEFLKKFNTRDGMGTAIWRASGRHIAVVTGENSPAVAARAKKLQLDDVHLGVKDKLPLVKSIAARLGVPLSQVAYIGDDLNDLESLSHVGIAGCPADAHSKILEVCSFVARKKGGEGCLREFIDWLLDPSGGNTSKQAEAVARAADV